MHIHMYSWTSKLNPVELFCPGALVFPRFFHGDQVYEKFYEWFWHGVSSCEGKRYWNGIELALCLVQGCSFVCRRSRHDAVDTASHAMVLGTLRLEVCSFHKPHNCCFGKPWRNRARTRTKASKTQGRWVVGSPTEGRCQLSLSVCTVPNADSHTASVAGAWSCFDLVTPERSYIVRVHSNAVNN